MTLGKDALQIETVNPHLVADAPGPLYIAPADYDLMAEGPGGSIVLYNRRCSSARKRAVPRSRGAASAASAH